MLQTQYSVFNILHPDITVRLVADQLAVERTAIQYSAGEPV